ncbi:MAG: 30S ribosomal protein S6 [Oscillospiraceae bacterium]|nr:30S ribosomal protein S6 [Oscillospiraceae bacterium]
MSCVKSCTKTKYGFYLVLSTRLSEEARDSLVNKFVEIISENEGEVESIDKWGKRRLAYQIKKESEGNYFVINFFSGPNVPAEIYRISRITDEVLRTLIIAED